MKKLSTSCEHTCFLFHMHYIDWPVSLLGLLPLQMGDIRQFSFLENSMASAAGIRRFNHHCHSVTDENQWLSRATLNKVIGLKPASPPSTDRPIAFARWRQSLPPICNTRFLGPTRVCHQTASRSVQPFCTAHPCVQHTDHVTCDVGSNSPHRTLRAAGDAGERSAQLDDIWHMINQMHITLWNSKVVLNNISPWAFEAATGQVLGAWNCVHFFRWWETVAGLVPLRTFKITI